MTEAQIAAVAGEYYVAHKLATLGFLPTLVRDRMPRSNLLVSSPDGERTTAVQVKSALNAACENEPGRTDRFSLRFPLGNRAVQSCSDNTFFCFVDLRRITPSAPPDVYVLPAATLKQEYEGISLRKYSQLYYQRPWQVLQPFRNNWEPIELALRGGLTRETLPRATRGRGVVHTLRRHVGMPLAKSPSSLG